MKNVRPYILATLSAGWLLPVYLTGSSFVRYVKTELEPRISGQGFDHSFPILDLCFFRFMLAVSWLGVVIFGWSIYFLRRERMRVCRSNKALQRTAATLGSRSVQANWLATIAAEPRKHNDV